MTSIKEVLKPYISSGKNWIGGGERGPSGNQCKVFDQIFTLPTFENVGFAL